MRYPPYGPSSEIPAESIEKMERDRVKIQMGNLEVMPDDIRRSSTLSAGYRKSMTVSSQYLSQLRGRDEIVRAGDVWLQDASRAACRRKTSRSRHVGNLYGGHSRSHLIIRPSGEKRISISCCGSRRIRVLFQKTLWPDFSVGTRLPRLPIINKGQTFGGIRV